MNTIDQRLFDELDKIDSAQGFRVAVWRHEPDESGASWDARVNHFRGRSSSTIATWAEVVTRLRAEFILVDDNVNAPPQPQEDGE